MFGFILFLRQPTPTPTPFAYAVFPKIKNGVGVGVAFDFLNTEMPKYYALYRVRDNRGMAEPRHKIDSKYYDKIDYREPETGDELILSFAADLGNLTESQLKLAIDQVKRSCSQIKQVTDWLTEQKEYGTVYLISGEDFDSLSAADQIRINRMIETYTLANKDSGVRIDLYKPLALCVKYARLSKKPQKAPDSTQTEKRPRARRKNTIGARLIAYADATKLIDKVGRGEVMLTSEELAEAVAKYDGLRKRTSSAIRRTKTWDMISKIQTKLKESHWEDKTPDFASNTIEITMKCGRYLCTVPNTTAQ